MATDLPPRTNWAGNIRYAARSVQTPASIDELVSLVRRSPRLRPLGTGHSFNAIGDTDGDLISLAGLPRRIEVDAATATVTVDGGLRYGDLCGPLHEAGFALPNLASLPHISIAGASTTGTHGSGSRNGALATAISRVELVDGLGELRTIESGDDAFPGVATSLGALGLITALTLRVEPRYDVAQTVYEDVPITAVLDDLDGVLGSAYSVSLFLDGRPSVVQVWRKVRVGSDADDVPPALAAAHVASEDVHPIPGMPPAACTVQRGIPGPWHERLPHFRLDHIPSAGDELQSEYLVARENGRAAIEAFLRLGDEIRDLVQVTEIRTIAADDLWLSPAFGRASLAIHCTWRRRPTEVEAALGSIEAALAQFEPRPHWGKLFTLPSPVLRERSPMLPRFAELARSLDPLGRFRNAFLDRNLFASD